MPNYASSAPGIYLEDIPPLARPIAGVSTSTAAFVGVAGSGTAMPGKPGSPVDADDKPKDRFTLQAEKVPKLVTSWEEFRQSFGDFHAENQFLAHAVYGFFNNGGTRCYVARVATANLADVGTCLDRLAAIDEISIVAVPMGGVAKQPGSAPVNPSPGQSDPQIVPADEAADTSTSPVSFAPAGTDLDLKSIHTKLIEHCTTLGDRVAILDCSADQDQAAIGSFALSADKKGFSALYFPWLVVANPLFNPKTAPAVPATIAVPPSGSVAGIYARTDATRGVHKAPANEVVLGALDVAQPVTKAQQGALNARGINCVRNFRGSVLVWGARTLASNGGDPEWKYVNVRRFINFLQGSIEQDLRWVVFEPNEPGLWQRIIRSVGDFLLNQWRAGALFGETPKEAFFVRCDRATNSGMIELGQVVTEIGVAVVKPAEFVIFKIQQQANG